MLTLRRSDAYRMYNPVQIARVKGNEEAVEVGGIERRCLAVKLEGVSVHSPEFSDMASASSLCREMCLRSKPTPRVI
jgi:hypothetical protein